MKTETAAATKTAETKKARLIQTVCSVAGCGKRMPWKKGEDRRCDSHKGGTQVVAKGKDKISTADKAKAKAAAKKGAALKGGTVDTLLAAKAKPAKAAKVKPAPAVKPTITNEDWAAQVKAANDTPEKRETSSNIAALKKAGLSTKQIRSTLGLSGSYFNSCQRGVRAASAEVRAKLADLVKNPPVPALPPVPAKGEIRAAKEAQSEYRVRAAVERLAGKVGLVNVRRAVRQVALDLGV